MDFLSPEIKTMIVNVMAGLGLYIILPTVVAIILFGGILRLNGSIYKFLIIATACVGAYYFIFYDLKEITIQYQQSTSAHSGAFFMPINGLL